MRLNHWISCLSTGFILATNPLFAKTTPSTEQLQVPQCLAKKITADYPVLAENAAFKIIDIPAADIDALVLLTDQVHCGRFVNVSHKLAIANKQLQQQTAAQLLLVKPVAITAESYEIKHEKAVAEALAKVKTENIVQTLTHLTSYYNRSATKDTGVETAKWLKAQFESMATEYGRKDTATYFVETGSRYKQPSLVTVIGNNSKEPAVVIGAHMDTLDGRMPGAGDDGSGSSSVMEVARVLLSSQETLKRPVYILWYAAEERGLVGSQYVVKDFMKKKIPVKAAIQFDMTGYRTDAKDPTMWVYRDYTDKNLSNFIAKLITHYVKVPVDYSRCGYGCSDHASWTEQGIPAAFPCESNFNDHNPYIHTSDDTMSLLTDEHMTNFTRLGVAFAIELASE